MEETLIFRFRDRKIVRSEIVDQFKHLPGVIAVKQSSDLIYTIIAKATMIDWVKGIVKEFDKFVEIIGE